MEVNPSYSGEEGRWEGEGDVEGCNIKTEIVTFPATTTYFVGKMKTPTT